MSSLNVIGAKIFWDVLKAYVLESTFLSHCVSQTILEDDTDDPVYQVIAVFCYTT